MNEKQFSSVVFGKRKKNWDESELNRYSCSQKTIFVLLEVLGVCGFMIYWYFRMKIEIK